MSIIDPLRENTTPSTIKSGGVSKAFAQKLKKKTEQNMKEMDSLIHKATPREGKPITKDQLFILKKAESLIRAEKKTVAAHSKTLPNNPNDKKVINLIHDTIDLLDKRAQKIRECLFPIEEAQKKALLEREAHDKKSEVYLNLASSCIQCMKGEPSKIVDPEKTLSLCFKKLEELGMKADDPAVAHLREKEAIAMRSYSQMKTAMRKFGEIHSNTNKKILELEAMKHLGLSDEVNGLIDLALNDLTQLRSELAHVFHDEPVRDILDLEEMNINELELHQQRLTQKLATPTLTFAGKNLILSELRAAGNEYQKKYAKSTNPERLMNCCIVLRNDGPYGRLADTLSSLIDVLGSIRPHENPQALKSYNEALGLGAAKSIKSAISDSIRGNASFVSNTMAAILKEVLKNTQDMAPQRAGLEATLAHVQATLAKTDSQGSSTASNSEDDTYQYL